MQAWQLAWLRFRRRASGLGGAIGLIAAVQGVIVLVLCAQPVVEAQAVGERVASLPAAQRWIAVTSTNETAAPSALGAQAVVALHSLTTAPISSALVYRPLSDLRYGRYQLLAAAPVPAFFDLQSGRWPSKCDNMSCEVLQVGDLAAVAKGFIVVGHATLRAGTPLEPSLDAGAPMLVASDAPQLASIRGVVGLPRALAWWAHIDGNAVAAQGLSAFLQRAGDSAAALSLRDARLHLDLPTTQLEATRTQVLALQQRMLGLVLCLLIVVLFSLQRIAISAREPHHDALRLAQHFGWSATECFAMSLGVTALVTIAGVCAGVLVGGIAGLIAFGAVHTFTTIAMWALVLAVSSVVVLLAGLMAQGVLRWVWPLLTVALWLAYARAAGLDVGVLVLAAGVGLGAALLPWPATRMRGSVFTRNFARLHATRLVALAVVVGFLSGFVVASSAYLATLRQGVDDTAVFRSPLATRIAWGDRLPLQDHTLQWYASRAQGAEAFPVRSVSATVHRTIIDAVPVQVLAVAPRAWIRMPEMEHQTGLANTAIARAVAANATSAGVPVHGGVLRADVRGLVNTVGLSVWTLNGEGESNALPMPVDASGRAAVQLPADTRFLLGLALVETPDASAHRAHAVGEGRNTLPAPAGMLSIRALTLDGAPLQVQPPSASPLQRSGTELRWTYALVGGKGWASFVGAPTSLRAVVDPETAAAAHDGIVALRLADDVVVPVHIAAIADRMPTLAAHFLVVDPTQLDQVLAATAPELMHVSEVWLTRTLPSTDRFTGLTVTTQSGVRAQTAGASLSTWSVRTFGLLGIMVLFVLFGIAHTQVRGMLRSADLLGWRAQGMRATAMQRSVRRLVSGIGLGAIVLSLPVVYLLLPVIVGATVRDISGTPAVPPLAPNFNWTQQGAALAAMALLLRLAVMSATRDRALREAIGEGDA